MPILVCTGNKGKLDEFRYAFQNKETILSLADFKDPAYKYIEPIENTDFFICNAAIKLFSAIKFIGQNSEKNQNMKKITHIIADDSGLCVPELSYLPGVHSAHFAGFPKDDFENNKLLISKIEQNKKARLYKDQKRLNAFFVCFLLTINVKDLQEFNFLKKLDFSKSSNLLQNDMVENSIKSLENKLLKKVDLTLPGGSFKESINVSLLCNEFPGNIFIDISYGFCSGEVSTTLQNNIPGAGHGYDPLFYPISNSDLSFASIPLSEKNKVSHRAFAMNNL